MVTEKSSLIFEAGKFQLRPITHEDIQNTRSRANFFFNNNTTPTTIASQGTPVILAYPSSPGLLASTALNTADWTMGASTVRFTYTGTLPKIFLVLATLDVENNSPGKADMTFQWGINGIPTPIFHRQTMQANDYHILSGMGVALLSQGDYLELFITNDQNADDPLIINFNVTFLEV